jgi:predicted dehydrogenase
MIEIALVGGAHIHTPGFIQKLNDRADAHVRSVWDHDASRAQRRAEALKASVVADPAEIWRDPSIKAVVICSETNRHAALVDAAARAGKHMFVEKPLGMGGKDAYAMAQAIERAGVVFQTGYFMRGSPVYRFLKTQIEAGAIGRLTRYRQSNCHAGSLKGWFDTEWRWMADPAQAGCGAFGDLGTHALDIMMWLLGEPTSVTARVAAATSRYGDVDEYGEGMLSFAGGVIATLAAGWVDVAHPVSLIISGTEGHAYVADNKLFFQSARVPGADGAQPWTDLPPALPHAFDLFLDALAGRQASLVTPREAAQRSLVMEALYASARSGKWVAPRYPRAAR